MSQVERRQSSSPQPPSRDQLRSGLSAAQLRALQTLELFKWELKFVRRPMFLEPVPVVVDREGLRHVVIRADGSIDETPRLKLRR
ncbi:hypothetical protein [Pseudoxanthomonas composti]|uniref:Uncharacterized protein n=1 Tax=Pseudoxanthomonas composti TaxID=2137479 RepID=A0A4Q1JW37_9GAMM|nr:hypothetical protein [Pseudoxanthomonas composti]RXR06493.1 hypothetical protein EPA99_07550 [Pseudoxanthomonas composti]